MAKKETDLTPLEVAKLYEENLAPWALAVARTCINQVLGDNFEEKNKLKFLQLQNLFAKNLEAAKL